MATPAVQAIPSHFHSALTAYSLAAAMRGHALDDDQVEALEGFIDPLFQSLVDTPAQSPGMIVEKGELIIGEYGECNAIPTYLVVALLKDVRGLIQ